MAQKLYACANFPKVTTTCPHTVTGEESVVIDKAADHVVHEHGLEDTPNLRGEIKASLIDVPPGS